VAKSFKPAGYDGKDAVRNVIKSHDTMLVSFPKELKLRSGLARGVTVRTDYAKDNPHVLIVTVENPKDYSAELAEFLGKAEAKAKAAAEKAQKKKDAAAYKKEIAEKKAKMTPSEQEISADATKCGVTPDFYPKGWRKGDAYTEGHPMYEAPEEEAAEEEAPAEEVAAEPEKKPED